MASKIDTIAPVVIENLQMIPPSKLCQRISAGVLVKIAASEPVSEENHFHAVIKEFASGMPTEIMRWPAMWKTYLQQKIQDYEDARNAPERMLTFVVPLPIAQYAPVATYPMPIIPHQDTSNSAAGKTLKPRSRKMTAVHNLQIIERPPAANIQNAKLFAFVLLINGGHYRQQQDIFACLNIRVPGKTAFCQAQPIICGKLLDLAYQSCIAWRGNMQPESAISFDGSWSQRRAALHCFGAFIDPQQRKVVDFDVVERTQGSYKGNFEGTSQAMETEVLRMIGERWVGDDKVRYFCHDKDNHAMKVLANDLNWELEEKLDSNHIIKTWKARFDELTMIDPERTESSKKPRRVNALGELQPHLLRWFYVVLRTDETEENKATL
jgi:hypothetical protein